jgi:hypothetical protein
VVASRCVPVLIVQHPFEGAICALVNYMHVSGSLRRAICFWKRLAGDSGQAVSRLDRLAQKWLAEDFERHLAAIMVRA